MPHKYRIQRRDLLKAALGTVSLFASSAWARAACTPPISSILGPAYRKGAPMRTRLCGPDEPGSPLAMSGTIVDAATCSPLPGVLLDVWQVDARGEYDMDSAAFHLRGKMKSRADGSYAFDTILPVAYGRRPKHIHFLLTHAGYEPRITQCYFEGDERNASDPYVKQELIIAAKECAHHDGPRPCLKGIFDIALEREHPVSAAAFRSYADYVGDYQIAEGVIVTVSLSGHGLHWHLSAGADPHDALDGEFLPRSQNRFFISEYDDSISFVRDEHGHVTHALPGRGGLYKKIR